MSLDYPHSLGSFFAFQPCLAPKGINRAWTKQPQIAEVGSARNAIENDAIVRQLLHLARLLFNYPLDFPKNMV